MASAEQTFAPFAYNVVTEEVRENQSLKTISIYLRFKKKK